MIIFLLTRIPNMLTVMISVIYKSDPHHSLKRWDENILPFCRGNFQCISLITHIAQIRDWDQTAASSDSTAEERTKDSQGKYLRGLGIWYSYIIKYLENFILTFLLCDFALSMLCCCIQDEGDGMAAERDELKALVESIWIAVLLLLMKNYHRIYNHENQSFANGIHIS